MYIVNCNCMFPIMVHIQYQTLQFTREDSQAPKSNFPIYGNRCDMSNLKISHLKAYNHFSTLVWCKTLPQQLSQDSPGSTEGHSDGRMIICGVSCSNTTTGKYFFVHVFPPIKSLVCSPNNAIQHPLSHPNMRWRGCFDSSHPSIRWRDLDLLLSVTTCKGAKLL